MAKESSKNNRKSKDKSTNDKSSKTDKISAKPAISNEMRNNLIIMLACAIVFGIAIYLFVSTTQTVVVKNLTYYEITETDYVSLPEFLEGGIISEQMTIYGIKMGDSMQDVISNPKFGNPDTISEFNETRTIMNFEYNKKFGVNNSLVIFNFVDNELNRITIKRGFGVYMVGKSNMNQTLRGIYDDYGLPQSQDQLPKFRLFHYPEMGMDVIVQKEEINGVSFYRMDENKDE